MLLSKPYVLALQPPAYRSCCIVLHPPACGTGCNPLPCNYSSQRNFAHGHAGSVTGCTTDLLCRDSELAHVGAALDDFHKVGEGQISIDAYDQHMRYLCHQVWRSGIRSPTRGGQSTGYEDQNLRISGRLPTAGSASILTFSTQPSSNTTRRRSTRTVGSLTRSTGTCHGAPSARPAAASPLLRR